MSFSNQILEIRTLGELYSFYEISSDHILTKSEYRNPLRRYNLTQPEACCQYKKNKTRCSKMHQHGYIVETHDGSQVLIGHCCAWKHLGLNDDQVKNQFKKINANEAMNIRRHKAEMMLNKKKDILGKVKNVSSKARELLGKSDKILSILPARIGHVLLDRWKRSDLEVFWEYQKLRKGIDEKGEAYEEATWHRHSYGKIKGLGLWLNLNQKTFLEKLLDIHKRLDAIPDKKSFTLSEIQLAEAAFNQDLTLNAIEREIQDQFSLIDQFGEPENLIRLIQLVSNQKVRTDMVVSAHLLIGEPCRVSPNKFVSDIDTALKRRYSSGSIRIAS